MPASDPLRIINLYRDLLEAWNRRHARDYANFFASDASVVGFDGSQLNGKTEIHSELERIFADHPTAAYVGKVREVRELRPLVTLLRAVAGMVPPGAEALNPRANAVQSMVTIEREGELRIALFHNTPAAYHERPEAAEQLTGELTEVLNRGEVVAEG